MEKTHTTHYIDIYIYGERDRAIYTVEFNGYCGWRMSLMLERPSELCTSVCIYTRIGSSIYGAIYVYLRSSPDARGPTLMTQNTVLITGAFERRSEYKLVCYSTGVKLGPAAHCASDKCKVSINSDQILLLSVEGGGVG